MKNRKELREKIMKGVSLAFEKLLASTGKSDGYLVFSENGKIVRVKARNFK